MARLRLLGSRADERLATLIASDAPSDARAAALKAIEGREDARARQIAAAACRDSESEVAIAAIGVLRGSVAGEPGTDALDALVGVAVDSERDAVVRQSAVDALSELPADIVRPLLQGLPESLLPGAEPSSHPVATIGDPLSMSAWINEHREAPLSSLHEAVTRIRQRESDELPPQVRDAWTAARGAAHAALAARGSRVALYDLRESFDSTPRSLPLDFLTAMGEIGDASCLEPMAKAWSAAPNDAWWRARLQDTATAVMKREALTARQAVVKRVRSKYPDFV
ncbi:MAG: hypothetical protein HOP16_00530 [Acidobacteria bacterium]|nr:hypothetical protein [Acidobacteriota bacterium]